MWRSNFHDAGFQEAIEHMRQVRRADSALLAENREPVGRAPEGLKERHPILERRISITFDRRAKFNGTDNKVVRSRE